jgi:glycosyltransferase involved in cell wall biosynthesis
VSIGLPVYNGERWLTESLDSLLAQTFDDFELIICDNASTDGTEAICRRYAEHDHRVRYLRNAKNIGGMPNASRTFKLARGDYFRWAADDDVCGPTLLERLIEVLDNEPNVVVAVSPSISIDSRGEPVPYGIVGKAEGNVGIRVSDRALTTDGQGVRMPTEGTSASPSRRFREVILTRGPAEASYGLIRSDVLRRTRLQQAYPGSDFVMLCDLALRGPFGLIDEPLFSKRWHCGNLLTKRGPGRMVWSRPELAESGRLSFPHWVQLWGYTSTVLRAHLPLRERVSCMGSILRWMRLKWKALAWDLAFALAMSMHSRDWRRRCYNPDSWMAAEGSELARVQAA